MDRSPGLDDAPRVYALVPRAPLPSFDASKTFHKWLLPAAVGRKYRSWTRQHHALISACYFLGVLFRSVGLLCPLTDATYWLVLLSPFLQTPGLLSVSLALCSDVVRLLFGLFDSWMLLGSMILWTVFLGMSFSDVRVVLLPYLIVDLQNAALTDAFVHPSQLFIASAVIAVVFISVLYVKITLNTQELANVPVLRLSKGLALTSLDMVQNTTLTVGLLVFRVAYNKLAVGKLRRDAVQTVVYRCKVKFQALEAAERSSRDDARVAPSLASNRAPVLRKTIHQLECIPFDEDFDARKTVVPRMARSLRRLSPVALLVLYGVGCVGFGCMAIVSLHSDPGVQSTVGVAALATTFALTSTFAAMYQRRLPRRLCRSFDCLFVLFQAVTAYVCIAHLSFWDRTAVMAMLCNLLWVLWVLGMDALTSGARHKLGLRLWFAVPVLLWNIAMSVNGIVDLSVKRDDDAFQDRVIFERTVWGTTLASTRRASCSTASPL